MTISYGKINIDLINCTEVLICNNPEARGMRERERERGGIHVDVLDVENET